MVEYDVVRIELDENPKSIQTFTRLKGELKKVRVWINGQRVLYFDLNMKKIKKLKEIK